MNAIRVFRKGNGVRLVRARSFNRARPLVDGELGRLDADKEQPPAGVAESDLKWDGRQLIEKSANEKADARTADWEENEERYEIENRLVQLFRQAGVIGRSANRLPADIEAKMLEHLLDLARAQNQRNTYLERHAKFRDLERAIVNLGGTLEAARFRRKP